MIGNSLALNRTFPSVPFLIQLIYPMKYKNVRSTVIVVIEIGFFTNKFHRQFLRGSRLKKCQFFAKVESFVKGRKFLRFIFCSEFRAFVDSVAVSRCFYSISVSLLSQLTAPWKENSFIWFVILFMSCTVCSDTFDG